jgi:hypothetical protein
MITLDQAWQIFLQSTKNHFDTGEIFYSPRRGNQYRIIEWSGSGIRIKRLSIESGTEVFLSKGRFTDAFNRIINSNGIIPKEGLYDTVAIEAPIVFFLPFLDWDEQIKNIIVDFNFHFDRDFDGLNITEEAVDDDINERILRSLRVRRGQNKLRDNLFTLHNGACCITGTKIKEVLHACHINPHRQTGDNRLSNALLLRSDIHDLFDGHLIGVNPNTYTVHVNPALLNTEYGELDGKKLLHREVDLNQDGLQMRWELFSSLLHQARIS